MAESVRDENSAVGPLSDQRREIIKEALRQSESCLYTSASLYEWLKSARQWHRFYVGAPIVLGSLASLAVLKDLAWDWLIALFALGASLFPALADGLKIQTGVDEVARLAGEFKALQDRFRRLARVTAPTGDVAECEKLLSELMDRMDVARSTSITPPDWAFQIAQEKVKAGDYDFAVDIAERAAISSPDPQSSDPSTA